MPWLRYAVIKLLYINLVMLECWIAHMYALKDACVALLQPVPVPAVASASSLCAGYLLQLATQHAYIEVLSLSVTCCKYMATMCGWLLTSLYKLMLRLKQAASTKWQHLVLSDCTAAAPARCQQQQYHRVVAWPLGQLDTGKHHHQCMCTCDNVCHAMHHLVVYKRRWQGLCCVR